MSDEEHIFSNDGTGLPNSIKQNYEREKRGIKKKKESKSENKKKENAHKFEQAIITSGTRYKMIASFIITENPCAAEGPYLEEALNNV